jgi:Piwi domain.
MQSENLFINTLAFEFPAEPKIFYFSKEDRDDVSTTKLSHQLFPCNIKDIFPDISNSDTIYVSFDKEAEGFQPLEVDFSLSENYYLVKRYYNRVLHHYLVCQNLIVEPNLITKDNQIWVYNNAGNKRNDCKRFDRFSLKLDFDQYNKKPQLVLSYDRGGLILKTSVKDFLNVEVADPFSESETPSPSLGLINKVLYVKKIKKENGQSYNKYRIDKHSFLEEKFDNYSTENAYPIINNKLATFLGFNDDEEEENENQGKYKPVNNKYTKYYNKIYNFHKKHLDNDAFRALVPISSDGFSYVNPLQMGHTNAKSKELVFGFETEKKRKIEFNPQRGVNFGPYDKAKHENIQLRFIFPKSDKETARKLLQFLLKDYKDFFKGLKKYTGREIAYAPSKYHIQFEDTSNPIPEIEKVLDEPGEDGVTYLAVYLTPISKHSSNKESRQVYYKVKEKLLARGIVSQCIETDKMLKALAADEGVDKYGKPLKNFAYTLQNIAIAINAKLGGTPWRLNVAVHKELIVGVGAFKNLENNTHYIGSAFSFDNTGAFNSFEYFQKDQLKELAGSIENAIINFSKINDKPDRLIIHYYKEMSLIHEFPHIENALNNLGLDGIPVYIVTINKTESEDFVLFDGANTDLLPFSGRYINLGNKTYLLCNNTRYENAEFSPRDGFPFPVKLKIECPTNGSQQIDTQVISDLIDQVYQFSRIYWKSVKQQNLPVTIKYPEMIAQILPYFSNTDPDNIDTKHLWFL